MFTGPVGEVEVFFHWPKAIFGEFLLAWGHRATVTVSVSVEPCCALDKSSLSNGRVKEDSMTFPSLKKGTSLPKKTVCCGGDKFFDHRTHTVNAE